jgi:hypothetical protein
MKLIIVLSIIFFAACSPFEVGQGISIDKGDVAEEQLNRPLGDSQSTPQNDIDKLKNGFYRGIELEHYRVVFIKVNGDVADMKIYDSQYECVSHVFTNVPFTDDGEVLSFQLSNKEILVDDIINTASSRFYGSSDCSTLFN